MKISKLLSSCIAVILSAQIHAAPVSFDVSGIENIEWLELTVMAGKSRLEVESMLAEGGMLDGWRYASRSEVETLYDSLWGGTTDGYSEDNFAGARDFFDTFGNHSVYGAGGYDENGSSSWYTMFGNEFECSVDLQNSCLGIVAIYDMDYGASLNVGYFHDDFGLSTGSDAINNQDSVSNLYGYPYLGSHLVREVSAVPVPAALWLFFSGMGGIAGVAYRSKRIS